LAYLVVRNVFALVWLLARPRRSKELEILDATRNEKHVSSPGTNPRVGELPE
jgi:hypothetical protein